MKSKIITFLKSNSFKPKPKVYIYRYISSNFRKQLKIIRDRLPPPCVLLKNILRILMTNAGMDRKKKCNKSGAERVVNGSYVLDVSAPHGK